MSEVPPGSRQHDLRGSGSHHGDGCPGSEFKRTSYHRRAKNTTKPLSQAFPSGDSGYQSSVRSGASNGIYSGGCKHDLEFIKVVGETNTANTGMSSTTVAATTTETAICMCVPACPVAPLTRTACGVESVVRDVAKMIGMATATLMIVRALQAVVKAAASGRVTEAKW